MGRSKSHRKPPPKPRGSAPNTQDLAADLHKRGLITRVQAFGHTVWNLNDRDKTQQNERWRNR